MANSNVESKSPLASGVIVERAIPSSNLVVPSESFAISLLDSISNAEVVEQPLVTVPSIRVRLETVLRLLSLALAASLTSIRVPAASLRYARHTKLARTDLDILAMQCAAGVRVQAGELSRAGSGRRHSRRLCKARKRVKGGGSGDSSVSRHSVMGSVMGA